MITMKKLVELNLIKVNRIRLMIVWYLLQILFPNKLTLSLIYSINKLKQGQKLYKINSY